MPSPKVTKRFSTVMMLFMLSMTTLISFTAIENRTTATHKIDRTNSEALATKKAYYSSSIYQQLYKKGVNISEDIFVLAFKGFEKLSASGRLNTDSILTIIDFSKSSREKRMFVIDLKETKLLFKTVVAHGKNSGDEYALRFSNKKDSHQSSLGFYITKSTYIGSNGYSLMLDGIEKDVNDKAISRAIVIHGAEYANESYLKRKGYLGRSFGCPALPTAVNKKVIDKIKQGNCMFIYYPDQQYLRNSKILNG